MANSLRKVVQRINAYVGISGMFTLLIMMLFTTCDVIGRTFFKAPIIGSYELTQYMLVIVVLLGIPYTQQVGGNIRITLFVSRLNPRAQVIIDIVITLLGLVFFLLIAWGGFIETVSSFRGGGVSDMLRIPQWPFRFLIPVGAFLLGLELLIKMITSLRELIKNHNPTADLG
jgi:TRAP-type C4-dicarboxylate transport system permease small subunit